MSQNLLAVLQKQQIQNLTQNKEIPYFKPGDTVCVKVEFSDGVTVRLQDYEGVVIAKKNKGVHSSFVVRKVVGKNATERLFPLYGTTIKSILVKKFGKVRRARLYYLRNVFGKSGRIKEDTHRKTLSSSGKKKV